tara:strand:+ start:140 stop:367 length:228 start_codon:yes stop_codon:yes gene_type:complete
MYEESMTEEKKNGLVVKNEHNEFELALRFLGNELIAIKMAATNFSGKLIVWSILLLLFSFMLIEVFEVTTWIGVN